MIGIFGGTFDPIHLGHIHVAKTLLARYDFEQILFVPTGQNPHKKDAAIASPDDRLEMVKLAIEDWGDERANFLDWEVNSAGPNYTIDLLTRFEKEFPEKTPVLIIGDEVFSNFLKWREPLVILQKANLVVVRREKGQIESRDVLMSLGIKIRNDAKNVNRYFHSLANVTRWIDFQEIGALPFSATNLRTQLGKKDEYVEKAKMPQGIQRLVWLYAKEKQLYSVNQ